MNKTNTLYMIDGTAAVDVNHAQGSSIIEFHALTSKGFVFDSLNANGRTRCVVNLTNKSNLQPVSSEEEIAQQSRELTSAKCFAAFVICFIFALIGVLI